METSLTGAPADAVLFPQNANTTSYHFALEKKGDLRFQ